ncbi:MAG: hypothetical protein ACREMQ_04445 [Longimicrobiales bacterium]
MNLLPFLTGSSSGSPHEVLYWKLGTTMAISQGDWKLVKMDEGSLREDPAPLSELSKVELYDLRDDISERKNLAASQRE